MAKRIVKWTLDGTILKLSKPLDDPKSEVTIDAEFDVSKLYTGFAEFNEAQKQLVVYAVKQKLMDSGASDIGNYSGKVQSAKDTFTELLEGKWKGDRVNATGSAENKRIASEIKDIAKVVSLEGLIVKKYTFPASFTAEDEEKLLELMEVKVKMEKSKRK
jgi:hypothetical protein